MNFPRLLLLCLFCVAAGPWLAVEAMTFMSSGAHAGTYVAEVDEGRRFGHGYAKHYRAPRDIGSRHSLQMPKYGLVGEDVARTYHAIGPTTGKPRPTIVLLHGGGRDGRSMLDMWKTLAAQEDIVLLAPTAAKGNWSMLNDGVFVAEQLIEHASETYPIDHDNVFLVRHSMGGKFAIRLANYGYGPWRGVQVHAASVWSNSLVPNQSGAPIQFHVGELDRMFTPKFVNAAAERLAQGGHDVEVTVIRNHTHWYYDIAPELAPQVWKRFQKLVRTGDAA